MLQNSRALFSGSFFALLGHAMHAAVVNKCMTPLDMLLVLIRRVSCAVAGCHNRSCMELTGAQRLPHAKSGRQSSICSAKFGLMSGHAWLRMQFAINT